MSPFAQTSAQLRSEPVSDPSSSTAPSDDTIVDPTETLVVLIVGGSTASVGHIVRLLTTIDACGVNTIVVEHATAATEHLETKRISAAVVFDDYVGRITRCAMLERDLKCPLVVVMEREYGDRATTRADERREGADFCLFRDEIAGATLSLAIVGAIETDRKIQACNNGSSGEIDVNTGLYTSNGFKRRVTAAIARSDSERHYRYSLLFVDLSSVRAGRKLDEEQAQALRSQVGLRLGNVCSRWVAAKVNGGYVVLFRGFDEGEDLCEVGEIQRALRAPYALGNDDITLRLGFGCARGRGLDADARAAIERAQSEVRMPRALLRSAFSKRKAAEVHDAANQLASELEKALDNQEFAVSYQPIVELESHRPVGFEALIRWSHPDGEDRSAAEFIDAAKNSNLIVPIGYWSLEVAMRQMADWRTDFPNATGLLISINLSPQQVVDPLFVARVESLLMTTGLAPSSVRFEIEASTIVDHPAESRALVKGLSDAGTRIWVEDFGIGNCTIDHLRGLTIDGLKIDRTFVSKIDGTEARSATIRHIINTAQALHVAPLAEGIENALQANVLRWLGCSIGQGYMYARPLALGDAFAYLAQQDNA